MCSTLAAMFYFSTKLVCIKNDKYVQKVRECTYQQFVLSAKLYIPTTLKTDFIWVEAVLKYYVMVEIMDYFFRFSSENTLKIQISILLKIFYFT